MIPQKYQPVAALPTAVPSYASEAGSSFVEDNQELEVRKQTTIQVGIAPDRIQDEIHRVSYSGLGTAYVRSIEEPVM